MASKAPFYKASSIESISTGLTYLALTGVFLAPLMTANGPLPPAIEAKAVNAPSDAATQKPTPSKSAAAVKSADAVQPANARPDEVKAAAPDAIAKTEDALQPIKASDEPAATTAKEIAPPKRPAARQPAPERKTAMKAQTPPPETTKPAQEAKPDPETEWSNDDVTTALKECLRLLAPVDVEVVPNPAMRKGDCGSPAPVLLKSIGTSPRVTFKPAVEVNCPMAVALSEWAKDTLQPAARAIYDSPVTEFVWASGYSCRNRYGKANTRLSEHALANAIDIGGFKLQNGKVVRLKFGWGSTKRDYLAAEQAKREAQKAAAEKKAQEEKANSAETPAAIAAKKKTTRASLTPEDVAKAATTKAKQEENEPAKIDQIKLVDGTKTKSGQFLRRLFKGACGAFGTVLGPEANDAHRDHFHFDLRSRKRRAICR